MYQPEKEAEELMSLMKDYKDIPRKSTTAQHDVDVGEEIPIKQHSYRMKLFKKSNICWQTEYGRLTKWDG